MGFNGTFSGANNPPTAFTLNGTACNGGTTPPQNTPPTVSLTSPTSGQQFNQGASVTLAANASDNSGVSRVEFRVDGALVSDRHHVAVQLQHHDARRRQPHRPGHGLRQCESAAVGGDGADSVQRGRARWVRPSS